MRPQADSTQPLPVTVSLLLKDRIVARAIEASVSTYCQEERIQFRYDWSNDAEVLIADYQELERASPSFLSSGILVVICVARRRMPHDVDLREFLSRAKAGTNARFVTVLCEDQLTPDGLVPWFLLAREVRKSSMLYRVLMPPQDLLLAGRQVGCSDARESDWSEESSRRFDETTPELAEIHDVPDSPAKKF